MPLVPVLIYSDHLVLQRRSSMVASISSSLESTEGLGRSHSFSVTASTPAGRWTPAAPRQQQQQQEKQQQQQDVAVRQEREKQGGGATAPPPGGAIKVNTDVMSGTMRPPRISVFMSKSARRAHSTKNPSAAPATAAPNPPPSMMPTAALPGGYDLFFQQHHLEPTMDRTASAQAQRLKDIRITTRASPARSVAEKYVVDHNPAVVAMGSPQLRSTSALPLSEDNREDRPAPTAAPTLRRASSVGALTIAGSGDIHSTSPVLSATGRIIQSCELSDRVGGGGQRRNLVCKVFGSGSRSPYAGPNNGGR